MARKKKRGGRLTNGAKVMRDLGELNRKRLHMATLEMAEVARKYSLTQDEITNITSSD